MRTSLPFLVAVVFTCFWYAGCSFAEDWSPLNDYYRGLERFGAFEENPFVYTGSQTASNFLLSVNGSTYTNARRQVNSGQKPLKDAIRTEEFLNYFTYNYPEPDVNEHISINAEIAACPWNTQNRLVRIGLKGKTIPHTELPPSNIVLLIDVSGSMINNNKLPLLQLGLPFLVNKLREQDKIAIVTYSGKWETVLPSTSGNQKTLINNAIQSLNAEGSSVGSAGINAAYQIALDNFVPGGNNRVILATDGDFNIGITNIDTLVSFVKQKSAAGIYLTAIGVGAGVQNEAIMERIAINGSGNYEYLDKVEQAQKLFDQDFGHFYSIADDAQIMVNFNPDLVTAFRLIGYENRLQQNAQPENDAAGAGKIGAGQTLTALYEIIPNTCSNCGSAPAFTINFSYKKPTETQDRLLTLQIPDENLSFTQATENLRFAASVAAYAMLLRKSAYKGTATYNNTMEWAQNAKTFDPFMWRNDFIGVVSKAQDME